MKLFSRLSVLFLSVAALAACSHTGAKTSSEADSEGKEKITVALEENARPLSYTDEDGALVGYEVDVIKEINQIIDGYQIDIETVSAEAAETGLQIGKYGLIGGGLYRTEEREKKFLYPDENTGVSTVEIYKQTDKKDVQTLEDLVGLTLYPVTANGGIYNLLTTYNEEHKDQQITINLGDSGEIAKRFQAVSDGEYDAIVMSSNFDADNIIKKLDLKVEKAKEPVQVNATYFVLNPKETEFKAAFDQAVKELKEQGTLETLSEKWFGQNMFQYEVTNK